MKKVRNSSVEILRIISMLFIVISHYSVHNGIDNVSISLGFNRTLLEISTLGNIGVIIFVLISGYFMIEQKKINICRIVSLYLQLVFYSLIIYLIFVGFNIVPFSIKELIKNILPITFNKYWFMSVYVVMYILSPFINKFLNALKRKEHLNFILLMLLLFSILPTFTIQTYYGNELVQFIMFYSIGAYLKKYPENIFGKIKNLDKILLILTSIILVSSTVLFDLLGVKFSFFNGYIIHFFNRYSIIAIIFSIALFNIFINKREFNNRFINIIASCVIGVYLIHDNEYVRSVLWTNILHNYQYIYSFYMIIHLIVSVALVFSICVFLEFIRKNTIEKLTDKLLNPKLYKLQNFVEKKIECIYKELLKTEI